MMTMVMIALAAFLAPPWMKMMMNSLWIPMQWNFLVQDEKKMNPK
uniref:Uncharacterized protein n=1 Tax=Rhizophora mucronata TaxID=61149 RepID=A0A2P2PWC2_RHIMU